MTFLLIVSFVSLQKIKNVAHMIFGLIHSLCGFAVLEMNVVKEEWDDESLLIWTGLHLQKATEHIQPNEFAANS